MQTTKLTRLVLVLSLTTFALGLDELDCGGALSDKPFDNIYDLLDYYSRCSYPTDKLNVECLLSSCPMLRGVCPLTSSGSVDPTALDAAVCALNACIGQNALICDTNMTRTQIVQISWTFKELVPCSMANGTIRVKPGAGYLSNLSKSKFTVSQAADPNCPITLTIDGTDITGDIDCNCDFSIPSTSVLTTLTPFLTSFDLLNAPNVHGNYRLNLTSTISIDLSTCPPKTNTLDDQYNLITTFTNFTNQAGHPVDKTVVHFFSEGMSYFMKYSVIHTIATDFLSTFAALGLQAAQQNCHQ